MAGPKSLAPRVSSAGTLTLPGECERQPCRGGAAWARPVAGSTLRAGGAGAGLRLGGRPRPSPRPRRHGRRDGVPEPHPHQAAAARRAGQHAHLLPGVRRPRAALLPAAPAGAAQPLRAPPHRAAARRLPRAPRRRRRGRLLRKPRHPRPITTRGKETGTAPTQPDGAPPQWLAPLGPWSQPPSHGASFIMPWQHVCGLSPTSKPSRCSHGELGALWW